MKCECESCKTKQEGKEMKEKKMKKKVAEEQPNELVFKIACMRFNKIVCLQSIT